MKVLIVKMSSLGDVVHTLPAITDLKSAHPEAEVHWAVEEAFVDIPSAHPGVDRVLPIAIRRWRKSWWRYRQEVLRFRSKLKAENYDIVLDAQGLIKSAIVGRMAGGQKLCGLNSDSAREPWASKFYDADFDVPRNQHAVDRIRQLFAQVFNYSLGEHSLDYGLSNETAPARSAITPAKKLMFLHGTTWASKHWPEHYWIQLAQLAAASGYQVLLPHGSATEKARAEKICAESENVLVLPPLGLKQLMQEMSSCAGLVSVDTGLGHLAVAMNKPLVGIYGATRASLTGFYGPDQITLSASTLACVPCLKKDCQFQPEPDNAVYPPCYADIPPTRVFSELVSKLAEVSVGDRL